MIVPIVKTPVRTKWPPYQNTSAVPVALIAPSAIKNQRPITADRTPISATALLLSSNLLYVSDWRPNNFMRRAPLTFRVSFIRMFMSALRSKDCRVMSLRRFATLRAGTRKSGNIAILMMVSCQFRVSIMDSVKMTRVVLVIMLINVPVTARWAPTTSLFRRAIISPVFVLVKKRKDICCIWP